MAVQAPAIDKRTYDQIVAQTEALVATFTPWRPTGTDGQQDAGGALIRIFSHLVELVLERLNRVPEKNFLAFLDLIGTQLRPPQPARVPLTFQLATGSPEDAFVPTGTQVAAARGEGEKTDIVFETDVNLVVTKAKLTAVLVREPDTDRYGDYTGLAKGATDESFPAFQGDRPMEHSLYLAHDDLFTLPGPKTVTLKIESPDAARLQGLPVTWSYWDGTTWRSLAVRQAPEGPTVHVTPDATQLEVMLGESRLLIKLGKEYANQTALLAIYYDNQQTGPALSVFPETQADKYPPATYIRLARLVIDAKGQVSQLVTSSVQTTEPADKQWQVVITDLPVLNQPVLNGLQAAWLQARLDIPLPRGQITIIDPDQALTQIQRQDLVPAAVVAGGKNLPDPGGPCYPFGKGQPLTDFFLSMDEVFVRADARVTLNLVLATEGQASNNLTLLWQFWDGDDWQELGQSRPDSDSSGIRTFAFTDGTHALTQSGAIHFNVPPNWQVQALAGHEGRWLQVHIQQGDYAIGDGLQPPQVQSLRAAYTWILPRINRITTQVEIERRGLAPEFGFTNALPLDLSKNFFPFGETPRFNDTLYLAHSEVFARPDAVVTATVTLSNPLPSPINPAADLEIAWEAWDGHKWQELGRSTPTNPKSQNYSSFNDTTKAFTQSGQITFILPAVMGQGTVNGVTGYWVRARIVRGNYGTSPAVGQLVSFTALRQNVAQGVSQLLVGSVRGFLPGDRIQMVSGSGIPENKTIKEVNIANSVLILDSGVSVQFPQGTIVMQLVEAVFGSPSVAALSLGYTYENPEPIPLAACQSCNDFLYVNHTVAAQTGGSPFAPFTPTAETRPTLYLGFDQPFSNRPITLYAQVEHPAYEEATSTSGRSATRLSWEYSRSASPSGWQPLEIQDETRTFAERGLLTFMGPRDFSARAEFDQDGYWLRTRWEDGTFQVLPRLRRLLTNTTWASQAVTINNEILGSSNGESNQVFRITQAPVLEGQQIEVQEVATATGEQAVAGPQEGWVLWQEQPDFYGSGPLDRHHVLDHLTGELRFGDGQNGWVPPLGRNNIRATYRTGGGTRGNRLAGTIIQLKSTVPYVDGVTNHETADGGTDQETPDSVKEHGPTVLRHRNRAVTAQDFEDLAYRASVEVARAKAITARTSAEAGRVGLILVPRSTAPQPIPSLEFLNRVEDDLRARCAPTLELWTAGPDWIKITVTVDIAPVSWQAAVALDATVNNALQRFLHPLRGGPDQQGWVFGRKPHKSDLYALLESIAGVGYVRSLSVVEEPQREPVRPDRFLVFSGSHSINLVAPEGEN